MTRLAATLIAAGFVLAAQDPDPVIVIPGRATSTRNATALQLAAGQLWRFPQPGCALMVGFNIKAFRESAEGRQALALLAASLPEPYPAALESFDEIFVSVEAGRKKSEPLVLITGRFDREAVAAMLQLKTPVEAGANAVLIGDAVAVAAARRRMRTASSPEGTLAAAAKKLKAQHDIWIAGSTEPLGAMPAAGMLEDIQSVQGGLSFRETVRAEVNIETVSPSASARILDLFEAGMKQAAETEKNSDQWNRIAKGIRAEQHDTGVRFRVELDPKDLPTPAGSSTIARLPSLGRPAKSSVTIHGLEGGDREIPYVRQAQ